MKRLKTPPRFSKAAPVSAFIKNIVQPICKNQGFVSATIILDWEKIVGLQFARLCQAKKITFPYKMKTGGCLHVTASSAMALAISYEKQMILEKVNQFYGYPAISDLRVHHQTVERTEKKGTPKKAAPDKAALKQNIDIVDIDYEPLRDALVKLGNSL
jgi:hypothetical protein